MLRIRNLWTLAAIAATLSACTGRGSAPVLPAAGAASNLSVQNAGERYLMQPDLPTPIQHVVIVFQENRTPDYLFQGIPNADISQYAMDSRGNRVALHETSLAAPWDLGHGYGSFIKDWDNGKMDGFDAKMAEATRLRPFSYAPESEAQPYHDMAKQYVFGDRMFATNRGPSFPAHLYIVMGTAHDPTIRQYLVRDNPYSSVTGKAVPGGCDAPKTAVVHTIKISDGSDGPSPWACLDRPTLADLLDGKNVSWRYYQEGAGPGLWHGYNAINHIRYGKDWSNVVTSSAQFLTDVKAGKLAGVSWVMPAGPWSDHAGKNGTARGPSWVAAIVNTIGQSQYWNNTAILITWDDWGGFYDHVAPPNDNAYELGIRVPLVIVSPYAKKSYVSKVQHEFGSLLAFTEETFGIPKGSLTTTDMRADDLKDAFNFTQKPRAFIPINAPPFNPSAGPNAYYEDP
ncbi:MAG TPA: alkaline phosphatase family protein [Candidatus Nitrosotalea sp.]|nr:alkaline phosphatase family protein [Candidatus Nitrosotalea sp.]